jgi:tetratricopeptide (TPR) repeat protein
MRRPITDLRGCRFGLLRVPVTAQPARSSPTADIQWPCICDCGTQKLVYAYNLTSGGTVSCGCWRADAELRWAATLKGFQDRSEAIAKLRRAKKNQRFKNAAAAAFQAQRLQALQAHLASAGYPMWGVQAEVTAGRPLGSAKRRRQTASSRRTRIAPDTQRRPKKGIQIQAGSAPAFANQHGPDLHTGPYQRAIAELDKDIQLQPNREAFKRRGNAYDALGQYQCAVADFDQAIRLQPDEPSVYYLRAIAKFKSGDRRGFQRDVRRAKDLGF